MNWGELARSVSSWFPLSSEMKMLFSSKFRAGSSHVRVFDPFQGTRVGQDKSDLPASAIFSHSFSLKYLVFQGAILWVSVP